MFGYINIVKDELKVKEYNLFRAYYCGLCVRQGKLLGQFSRLLLSYDFTSLAVLLDGLSGLPDVNGSVRCGVNPLVKRPLAGRHEVLDYCANMSVALAYFKLKDDAADENSITHRTGAALLSSAAKKVAKRYPEKMDYIKTCIDELSQLEKENCNSVDLLADTSAKMMGEIFSPPLELSFQTKRTLRQLGSELGRWLYIADAIDDYSDDVKKGRFTPFASLDDAANCEQPLWYNLHHASAAYELLDLKSNKGIMDNIIYFGLNAATQKAINKLKGNGGNYEKSI